MNILGIETSCDDTAISIVKDGQSIKSNIIASQVHMHEKYGGIIPEIASREHFLTIIPTINESLHESGLTHKEIDCIAVTNGPGLAGSLLVGVNAAKGLGLAWDKPVMPINHLEGHIYSGWLDNKNPDKEVGFPLICLIASGGHTEMVLMKNHLTYEIIGKTRDDAAGEAFDKTARVLRLGFPGGPEIQKEAESANGNLDPFPRPEIKDSLDFSFSGLKTAVVNRAIKENIYPHTDFNAPNNEIVSEYSFAFQEAIVDTLIRNISRALKNFEAKGVLLGGGVAANSRLREKMAQNLDIPLIAPKPYLCTDNGAMIASAAYYRIKQYGTSPTFDMDVVPNLKLH
tara:strand:- start:1092 stop:2120 length:1029 start_codon:yes stop_codon:yes gene_type:complete